MVPRDLETLFDSLFIGFDRYKLNPNTVPSYPPYNVVKVNDDTYVITLAIAGFGKDDIDLETRDGVLTIKGSKVPVGKDKAIEDSLSYLHKGIANRQFKLSFTLDKYLEPAGAMLENGLLHVKIVRNIPEEAKPKKVPFVNDQFLLN